MTALAKETLVLPQKLGVDDTGRAALFATSALEELAAPAALQLLFQRNPFARHGINGREDQDVTTNGCSETELRAAKDSIIGLEGEIRWPIEKVLDCVTTTIPYIDELESRLLGVHKATNSVNTFYKFIPHDDFEKIILQKDQYHAESLALTRKVKDLEVQLKARAESFPTTESLRALKKEQQETRALVVEYAKQVCRLEVEKHALVTELDALQAIDASTSKQKKPISSNAIDEYHIVTAHSRTNDNVAESTPPTTQQSESSSRKPLSHTCTLDDLLDAAQSVLRRSTTADSNRLHSPMLISPTSSPQPTEVEEEMDVGDISFSDTSINGHKSAFYSRNTTTEAVIDPSVLGGVAPEISIKTDTPNDDLPTPSFNISETPSRKSSVDFRPPARGRARKLLVDDFEDGDDEKESSPAKMQKIRGGRKLERAVYSKWNSDEDEQLVKAVIKHGQRWDQVTTCVEGRSYHQVRQRWLRGLKSGDALPPALKHYQKEVKASVKAYEDLKRQMREERKLREGL